MSICSHLLAGTVNEKLRVEKILLPGEHLTHHAWLRGTYSRACTLIWYM